jgi:choice-of-anchor C domain-containing protein
MVSPLAKLRSSAAKVPEKALVPFPIAAGSRFRYAQKPEESMKKFIVLTSLAVISLTAAPFTNGSFETGPNPGGTFITYGIGVTPITGWEVTVGNIDYIGGLWMASEGGRSLDMNGLAAGKIQQTFDTILGVQYRVLFDMAGNFAGPAVKEMVVSAGADSGTYTFDVTGKSAGNMGWLTKEFFFTALGDTTTLSFQSLTTACCWGPALDNVRVEMINTKVVPEPSTMVLAAAGILAAGLLRRR